MDAEWDRLAVIVHDIPAVASEDQRFPLVSIADGYGPDDDDLEHAPPSRPRAFSRSPVFSTSRRTEYSAGN